MDDYVFDVLLRASVRIRAQSPKEARNILREVLDDCGTIRMEDPRDARAVRPAVPDQV